ncbi:hypothetical protein NGM10_01430 [Halorussus salilacus]|uniref:hypothetical protein n=1 Tax=Halorussus salilacus TaxID=2953750 RepID=UPI0020A00038|nr:hypothetical protein [Halorussus salilacus]USZ68415.1 hypothetical protein NGM10_01430 [Halorussus salilacus]
MSYDNKYYKVKDNDRSAELAIHVYPNTSDQDKLATRHIENLKKLCDQLIDYDAIHVARIERSDEHPNVSGVGIKDVLCNWIKKDGENNKNSVAGFHLLVTSPDYGGMAESYNIDNCNPDPGPSDNPEYFGWKVSANGVVGWRSYDTDYAENWPLHEPGHSFLDMENENLQDYVEQFPDKEVKNEHPDQEHSLGTRQTDGKITIMGSGYPKAQKEWGACNHSESKSGHVKELSHCALQSYLYSAKKSEN